MPYDKVTLTVTFQNRFRDLMVQEGFLSLQEVYEETGIAMETLEALSAGNVADQSNEIVAKLLWLFDCKYEDLFQFEVESDEPNHWNDFSDAMKAEIEQALAEGEALLREKTS